MPSLEKEFLSSRLFVKVNVHVVATVPSSRLECTIVHQALHQAHRSTTYFGLMVVFSNEVELFEITSLDQDCIPSLSMECKLDKCTHFISSSNNNPNHIISPNP